MDEELKEIYAGRRARVLAALDDAAAMVLAAGPELRAGRGRDLRYRPEPELYFLTGYTEPEAVAVLAPGADEPFTLFVRPRAPELELWTGVRGGVEAARDIYGADAAYPIAELAERLPTALARVDDVYVRIDSGREDVDDVVRRALVRGPALHQRTGRGPLRRIEPGVILDEMRLFKDAHELALMREAARITAEAFEDAARAIRPGAGEWEVEAALDGGFRRRGADGPSFDSIVAAGADATVLHYVANAHRMEAGELLLIDAGASYRGYAGDISRTFPVSGTFTAQQRTLYDAVLAAHDAGIAAVRPGATIPDVHAAAVRVLVGALVELALVEGDPDEAAADAEKYKAFYPHKTSHWLGLDVHDVGDYIRDGAPRPLAPGMVLTVEPGLYIPATLAAAPELLRGTGIRIEDDVLVTDGGCDVLTAGLPTAAEALAALQSD